MICSIDICSYSTEKIFVCLLIVGVEGIYLTPPYFA